MISAGQRQCDCVVKLSRFHTVVPNLSFEKMPEDEMLCEMKRTLDTFERMLPLHIVPKSNGPGAASIWYGDAATGNRRRRSARPRRFG